MAVSDIYSLVKGALDQNAPDTTEEDQPTALENETAFKKQYKQHTGVDLHEQRRPVNMGTAANPNWQNSLVYKMKNSDGSEYNYVPAIHGPDHAFQSNDHISQIPSVHHVNGGPNEEYAETSPDDESGENQGPIDLGRDDPGVTSPGKPMVGMPNQGPTNTGATLDQNPYQTQQKVVADPETGLPMAPGSMPGLSANDVPTGVVTDPETGLPIPGNPSTTTGSTATSDSPVNTMGQDAYGTMDQNQNYIPGNPQAFNSDVQGDKFNADGSLAMQDGGSNATGAPLPGVTAKSAASTPILSPEYKAPLKADGTPDIEKALYDLINSKDNESELRKQAGDLLTESAKNPRQIVNPKLSGAGLGALALVGLLAGKHGADIAGGAVKGIKDATQSRQAQSDADWQAKQATAAQQAKTLLDQAKEMHDSKIEKIADLFKMRKSDIEEMYRQGQIDNNKQKNLIASNRIKTSLTVAEMRDFVNSKSVPARLHILAMAGIDDPDQIQLAKAITPGELQTMANAHYIDTKNANAKEAQEYKLLNIQSKTNLNYANTGLAQISTALKASENDMKELQIKNYPAMATAKLAEENAKVQETLANTDFINKRRETYGTAKAMPPGVQAQVENHYKDLVTKSQGAMDAADVTIEEAGKQLKVTQDEIKAQQVIANDNQNADASILAKKALQQLRSKETTLQKALNAASASKAQNKTVNDLTKANLTDFQAQKTATAPKMVNGVSINDARAWVKKNPTPANIASFKKSYGENP